MSENRDLSKYFGKTEQADRFSFDNVGFRQLAQNEELNNDSTSSGTPQVCTLFQATPTISHSSDPSSFFDMIGSDASKGRV